MALQTVVSRNIHPLDPTVGAFHGGTVSNVIPERTEMILTIRSFDPKVRDQLEQRIRMIVEGQAASYDPPLHHPDTISTTTPCRSARYFGWN